MKDHQNGKEKNKTVSSQAKISDTTFNQNFFDLQKWVYCNGTDRQTYGHGNFMTHSAKRAKWLKRNLVYLVYFKNIVI